MSGEQHTTAGNDPVADMQRRIEEARRKEEELLDGPGVNDCGAGGGVDGDGNDNQGEDDDGPDQYFVSRCFSLNERGDGMLFSRLNRDRFVFVKTTGEWLVWNGHHWSVDKRDLSHNAVDLVAQRYEQQVNGIQADIVEAEERERKSEARRLTELVKKYKQRVKKLRGIGGAKACLEWAHKIGPADSLAIVGEEIDQKPMLLPCANGVIDLVTGKLLPGRPDDYLVKAIPIEWKGIDAPRPEWERFIAEIHVNEKFESDPDIVSFIRRLLGYGITGKVTEHFIAFFLGEGRNGKGTMFEVLRGILGDLSWSVQSELILEQKNARSSAGPSPDMVSLQGRRLVVASEIDENRRVSLAKVKLLTGADTINARSPHDRFELNFAPTHKLFFYTNHVPPNLTSDYAMVKRLLYLKYPLKFVDNPQSPDERPRDPELPEKLRKEASGILAWLVQGCLEWQKFGLAPPAKIRADVEKLMLSQDSFLGFFTDAMEKTESDIPVVFAEIYDKYKQWYQDNISDSTSYLPSKKKVSAWLERRGYTKETKGGTVKFKGLSFKAVTL